MTLAFGYRGTSSAGSTSSSEDAFSSDSVSSSSSESSESSTAFFDFEFNLVILTDLLVLEGWLEGYVDCTDCRVDLRLFGIGASLES